MHESIVVVAHCVWNGDSMIVGGSTNGWDVKTARLSMCVDLLMIAVRQSIGDDERRLPDESINDSTRHGGLCALQTGRYGSKFQPNIMPFLWEA